MEEREFKKNLCYSTKTLTLQEFFTFREFHKNLSVSNIPKITISIIYVSNIPKITTSKIYVLNIPKITISIIYVSLNLCKTVTNTI